MALFAKTDLNIHTVDPVEFSSSAAMERLVFIRESAGKSLASAFPAYQEKTVCVSFSRNKWSAHEMLAHLLTLSGVAKVWVTSWSITEEPARKLVALRDSGIISHLSCLFGERLRVLAPGAFQLLQNKVDRMALARIHAKVIVIRSEGFGITVIGSANFSKNKRTEAAAVIFCQETAKDMSEQIENEISNAIK